jgi:hypothetical protein
MDFPSDVLDVGATLADRITLINFGYDDFVNMTSRPSLRLTYPVTLPLSSRLKIFRIRGRPGVWRGTEPHYCGGSGKGSNTRALGAAARIVRK